jgi:hypothetical protein
VGSALDGDGTINMGIDDRKGTDVFGVKLFGCFMFKNEAFIAWLVIVLTVFVACTSKIIINNNFLTFLKNSKARKSWNAEEHIAIEHDSTRSHSY